MDTDERASGAEVEILNAIDRAEEGPFVRFIANKETRIIDVQIAERWSLTDAATRFVDMIKHIEFGGCWFQIPYSIPRDQQLCLIVEQFKHHSITDLAVYYQERSIFRQWQGMRQWPVEHVKYWMAIPEVPRG